MKQTSRKKVLLSSVAMMMVATVSLGSATYAWFSTKTTATAKGLNAGTTQASNLVLSETGVDGTWVYDLDYKMEDTILEPVSTSDFTNWFTATALEYNKGTADPSTVTKVDDTNAGKYYVAKNLFIKNDGSEPIKVNWALKVTEDLTGDADFFRVALVKVTPEAPDGFVYANAADPNKPFNESGVAGTGLDTTDKTIAELGTLQPGVAYQYRVYMYYEGTDKDCIDANARNMCDVDFTFNKVDPQP